MSRSEQLVDHFEEIRSILADFDEGALVGEGNDKVRTPSLWDLFGLASAARRDGYPTASMRESSRQTTLDDDKMPIAPISDSVGELAVGAKVVDPIIGELRSIVRDITDSVGNLRRARGRLIHASKYAEVQPGEPQCSSCQRVGEFAEVYRKESGLCRWCYGFFQMNHRLPPITLVEAHHDPGRKVTTEMVRKALKDESDARHAKGKKR